MITGNHKTKLKTQIRRVYMIQISGLYIRQNVGHKGLMLVTMS